MADKSIGVNGQELASEPGGDGLRGIERRSEAQAEGDRKVSAQQWVQEDLKDFSKLEQNWQQEHAAVSMAANSRSNPEYRAALQEAAPAVAARVKELDAEQDKKISAKEEFKAAEMPPFREAEKEAAARGGRESAAKDNQVEAAVAFTATQPDARPVLPPGVERPTRDSSVQAVPNSSPAIEDRGNKLATRSDSEQTADEMVRTAKARGWDEVKVTGSEAFRREAYVEAAAQGLEAKGYTPTVQDKAEAAKRAPDAEAVRHGDAEVPARSARGQAFANERSAEALSKHPELAGAYAAEAAMARQAEAQGLDPSQRAAVAARVRQNVGNAIDRGEIPEVRVREEVEVERGRGNGREVVR